MAGGYSRRKYAQ